MAVLLIILIYVAFISLGLPDGLLGASWPSLSADIGAPISYAGYLTMIVAGGTIVSSLASDRLSRKVSTQVILVVSVALTAVAIFGYSFSTADWQLCLWSIPFGLGAGAVDSTLNNYVSLHYKSRQMNWLHAFWGVGASLGPVGISFCLKNTSLGWTWGYKIVGIIQCVLILILLFSRPLWKVNEDKALAQGEAAPKQGAHLGFFKTWALPGTAFVFLSFFAYCSLESTTGLWAASYLVNNRAVAPDTAALWDSLFYFGIMGGRFLVGCFANKLGDRRMVRLGIAILAVGLAVLALPFGYYTPLVGLLLMGIGCAPVYPSLIHETPTSFGSEHSQEIIGIQMASAYVGSTFMPPLFGLLAEKVDFLYFPYYLIFFFVLLVIMSECLNHATKDRWAAAAQKS